MKLSPTWDTNLQRYSAKFLALGVSLTAAWAMLSPELRALLPDWLPRLTALGIFGAGFVGTFLAQPAISGAGASAAPAAAAVQSETDNAANQS